MAKLNYLYTLLLLGILSFILSTLACSGGSQVDESFTEGLKNINNTGLYCKASGTGEPIIVVHGGPGLSHDYLYPHLQGLADRHRLIFYDQRACGRSSIKVDTSTVRLDRFIQDLDGIRKAFGIDKVNLMAHSWGGLLAMKYAIEYPDQMNSLILVNSVGASNSYASQISQAIAQRFTREDSLRRGSIIQTPNFMDSLQLVEELMTIGFRSQFYQADQINQLKLNLNSNVKTSSQLLRHLSKDLTKYDFYPDLRKLKTPTLLVYGDYDPLAETVGSELNFSITGSQLEVFENCGHFPFIEKPTKFNTTVQEFLAQHSAQQGQ